MAASCQSKVSESACAHENVESATDLSFELLAGLLYPPLRARYRIGNQELSCL